VAVALVLAAASASAGTGAAVAGGDTPIDRARRAAQELPFSGSVSLRWTDQRGEVHATEMQVRAAGGVLRFQGPAPLAATPAQRWLFRNGAWDLMTPAGLPPDAAGLSSKYVYTTSEGPAVAGRPTTLVELRSGTAGRELLYLDAETGLLLRRDQLDATGRVVRAVAFEDLQLGTPSQLPVAPQHSVDLRPRPAAVASFVRAPAHLAGDYHRVGVLRRSGALQVLYSDGLHGLSLFAQPGRLDRRALPPGGASVRVGASMATSFTWAGGQVVLWQARGAAYTVVGDGEPADVLEAARSIPAPAPLGAWDRLRQSCRAVLEAVSGR
jgi:sigma-E factor negative regulatory protein RseB